MNKVLFSHKSDIWETPKKIYQHYKKKGYFDPCPINPTFDGLKIKWKKKNFVNPPYSQISKWIEKGIDEAEKGNMSLFLIPARTDTKWFKKLFLYGVQIIFITGRLKFSEKGNAPFPNMLVRIDGPVYHFTRAFIMDAKEFSEPQEP